MQGNTDNQAIKALKNFAFFAGAAHIAGLAAVLICGLFGAGGIVQTYVSLGLLPFLVMPMSYLAMYRRFEKSSRSAAGKHFFEIMIWTAEALVFGIVFYHILDIGFLSGGRTTINDIEFSKNSMCYAEYCFLGSLSVIFVLPIFKFIRKRHRSNIEKIEKYRRDNPGKK